MSPLQSAKALILSAKSDATVTEFQLQSLKKKSVKITLYYTEQSHSSKLHFLRQGRWSSKYSQQLEDHTLYL